MRVGAAMCAIVLVLPLAAGSAQTRRPAPKQAPAPAPRKVNISYEEARPIVEAFAANQPAMLPDELRGKSSDDVRAAWAAWVSRRDADIRARLAQGDEDSLVNFLLFGVSFTRQPRATAKDLARFGEGKTVADVVQLRLDDMVAGIASPGTNERLKFARGVVEIGRAHV